MNFSEALNAAKEHKRFTREAWNKGSSTSFVVMMPELKLPSFNTQDTENKVNDRTAKWIGEDTPLNCRPYLAICHQSETAIAVEEIDPNIAYVKKKMDTLWQPGWVPNQMDLFAEDYQVISV